MILYMYIAPEQGLTTPWGRNLMSTGTSCHFGHLLQVSKKSLWSRVLCHFFSSYFIHVNSRRSGVDNHRGQNFDVNRNLLSLCSFALSFKKFSLKSDFILFSFFFFMILHMYIAPGQGLTPPRGRNFNVNRNILSLRSFVASFKRISLKSSFIQFCSWFIHVYSPRAGADSPRGTKFWCQQKCLVTSFICCKFQKMSLKSDFIQFLYDLIHVYSHGTGIDSPQGTKFWCQQKDLIILPICCKFQRNLFEVWFYTFFSWFNTCI